MTNGNFKSRLRNGGEYDNIGWRKARVGISVMHDVHGKASGGFSKGSGGIRYGYGHVSGGRTGLGQRHKQIIFISVWM